MDRFDREILDYVRSWASYGGPPVDEVLTEFGMTRDQLYDRVHAIVTAERARHGRICSGRGCGCGTRGCRPPV